ncbi:MAG: GHKL domain-containing protein [Erysipelotrichaceae bacterium]|nr:GHKL domain-containing protein [Erysipelotrichaceae bacterium]
MYGMILNIIEASLIIFSMYFCTEKRYGKTVSIIIAVLFTAGLSLLINHTSILNMMTFPYLFLELIYNFIFLSIISEESLAYRLFIATVPLNVIGIEKTIQNMTVCFMFFHKLDYVSLYEQLSEFSILISQYIYFYISVLIVYYVRKIKDRVEDRDYYLLSLLFTMCCFISLILENTAMNTDNADYYLAGGAYLILLFIIVLIFLFVSVYRHSRNESRQKLELEIMEKQISSNEEMLKTQKELYEIKHDIKHFMNILKNNNLSDIENAQDLIQKYDSVNRKTIIPVTTISNPINYVLNIKREEAINKGIDVVLMLNVVSEIKIDDDDLILILSNLLDNAIEHIGIEKKMIVEMKDVNEMFMIKITNSIDLPVLTDKGTFINENREGHGYGIRTVRMLVEKYDGFINFVQDSDNFTATVLLKRNDFINNQKVS